MSRVEIKCPHCGQPVFEKKGYTVQTTKYKLIGAVVGLLTGLVFDYFYFYIGVITDFFSVMPLIHIIACVLIGILAGWIYGEKKELNAYRAGKM